MGVPWGSYPPHQFQFSLACGFSSRKSDKADIDVCFDWHHIRLVKHCGKLTLICRDSIALFLQRSSTDAVEMKAGMFIAVAGVILLFSLLVLPCEGQRPCSPLAIPLCQGLPYDTTILNRGMQQNAVLELQLFYPLVKAACSDDLAFFLCSVYAPICTLSQTTIPPCRSLCSSARRGCEDVVRNFGFTWPEKLNCERFPEFGESLCVGDPGEPTPQPPTTDSARGKFDLTLLRYSEIRIRTCC